MGEREIEERVVAEVCVDCKGAVLGCPHSDGPKYCEAYQQATKKRRRTKAKGIPMSIWSVRAILDGRKTQTRRVMKPQPDERCIAFVKHGDEWLERWDDVDEGGPCLSTRGAHRHSPPWQPGDVLYVREGLARRYRGPAPEKDRTGMAVYEATREKAVQVPDNPPWYDLPWRWQRDRLPSIFMPREAARIWLRVLDVRPELIQQISQDDAQAEGVGSVMPDYVMPFARLWDSLNADRGFPFESNPAVWAVTFERLGRWQGGPCPENPKKEDEDDE